MHGAFTLSTSYVCQVLNRFLSSLRDRRLIPTITVAAISPISPISTITMATFVMLLMLRKVLIIWLLAWLRMVQHIVVLSNSYRRPGPGYR